MISKEYQTILDNSHHFTNVWFVNPSNALLAKVKADERILTQMLEKRKDAEPKRLLIFETVFMPVDESVLVDGSGRHWVISDKSRRRF